MAQEHLLAEYSPPEWRGDAQLRDVFFVDHHHGWAVGQRGLILRTTDGGQSWQQVAVPYSCALESVFFVDAQQGWAVGGAAIPYLGQSVGLVLRTDDGGRNWRAVRGATVPRLRRVSFVDRQRGFAVGDRWPHVPSGVYQTRDGGNTWSSEHVSGAGDWVSAARMGETWLATDGIQVARIKPHERRAQAIPLPDHKWNDIKAIDERRAILVGDGGAMFVTLDGGSNWRPINPSHLPVDLDALDLRTAAVSGSNLWVAGNPGTYVIHFDMETGTATAQRTGITVPIQSMCFVDETTGWAVGALGTIIATNDGGKTWRVQRQASDRVAILVVADSVERIPWETIARYSAEVGWRTCILVADDSSFAAVPGDAAVGADQRSGLSRQRLLPGQREQAAFRLGVSAMETMRGLGLPVIPAEKAATETHAAAGSLGVNGELSSETVDQLVRQLRIWRPTAILTCEDPAQHRGGLPPLTRHVQRAVELAAEPSHAAQHATRLALQPWRVSLHLFTLEHSRELTIVGDQFAPQLGETLADMAALSRALVGGSTVGPREAGFGVAYHLGSTRQSGDWLADLAARDPQAPRRPQTSAPRGRLGLVRHTARKRQLINQLAQWQSHRDNQQHLWMQGITSLVAELEPATAAHWLYQLAELYLEQGRPQMAAQSLALLVQRYPEHALAPASAIWLTNYWAADAWHLGWDRTPSASPVKPQHDASVAENRATATSQTGDEPVSVFDLSQSTSSMPPPAASLSAPEPVNVGSQQRLVWTPVLADDDKIGGARRGAGASSSNHPGSLTPQGRIEEAQATWRFVQQKFPSIGMDAEQQFLLAQARRKIDGLHAVDQTMRGMAQDIEAGWWSRAAAAETKMDARRAALATPAVTIARTDQWPELDGRLTDEVWQQAIAAGSVLNLVPPTSSPRASNSTPSASGEPVARVLLATDGEFLYLGAQCLDPSDNPVATTSRTRGRNANLVHEDRIELLIDPDRLYGAYFQLAVDHRGLVFDACAGVTSWNPDWFVAHHRDDRGWTVEAAIPLSELTFEPPPASDAAWAIAAQRVRGNQVLGAWGGPAAHQPVPHTSTGILQMLHKIPDRFGWIHFAPQPAASSEQRPSRQTHGSVSGPASAGDEL